MRRRAAAAATTHATSQGSRRRRGRPARPGCQKNHLHGTHRVTRRVSRSRQHTQMQS